MNKKACLCPDNLDPPNLGLLLQQTSWYRTVICHVTILCCFNTKDPTALLHHQYPKKNLKLVGNGANVSTSSLLCNAVLHAEMQTLVQ